MLILIRSRFIESGIDENLDYVVVAAAIQHMEIYQKESQ